MCVCVCIHVCMYSCIGQYFTIQAVPCCMLFFLSVCECSDQI